MFSSWRFSLLVLTQTSVSLSYFGFFRLLVPVGSFLHARVTAFSLTQNIYITVDMGSGSSKEKAALSSQLDELNQKYVGMHHEGRWRVAY